MPGSVANAAPADVLPQALCSAFAEIREPVPTRIATYHDGSTDRSKLASSSRRRFRMTQTLTPADLATLYAYAIAHPVQAFYYYNPMEPVSGHAIGSNYDGTGASLTGRYTVRFGSAWEQTVGMARTAVPVELIEVA